MASAVRVGTEGSVTVADGGTGAALDGMNIFQWRASFPRPINDVTPFNPSGNARQGLGGKGSIRGSFSGYLDDTTPVDASTLEDIDAAAATITLIANRVGAAPNNQQQVSFSGWISNVSVGVDAKGNPNTVSADFVGTGAPTWALSDSA